MEANDNYWVEEHERLMGLLDAATAELNQYPGVVAVEIGIKETGGHLTDELSFRVYVQKKESAQNLAPEAMIPAEIQGVKTDVIESDIPVATFDDQKYRPVRGGIQIGNEEGSTGTLGCIARRNSDNAIVVLSNAHVLMGGGASGTVEVGQPNYSSCCCCACNEIGEVVAQQSNAQVDCAIAKLDDGTNGTNIIRILNNDGTDGTVNGSAAAVVNPTAPVKKVGRTSDKTLGQVTSITHSTSAVPANGTPARINQILVRPAAGTTLFQDRGDSGAVLVDGSNQVIGLMWGAYLSNPTSTLYGYGIACPISAVLTAMGITIISGSLTTSMASATVSPLSTSPLSASPLSTSSLPTDVEVVLTGRKPSDAILPIEYLQARLAQTEQGQIVLHLIDIHRSEVLDLINHNRAVTVAWHRNQGPAFLAAIARSLKPGLNYHIPNEIEGVTRQQALTNIALMLSEHGSPALKAVIKQHILLALQLAKGYDTVNDVLDAFEQSTMLASPVVEKGATMVP